MKRILQTLLLVIATASISFAQYTLIPDAKFEAKLISLGIDKDGSNGKVLTSSIVSVTSLNVYNSQISDLTGIEGFTALTNLECSNNQLTNLNVTKNTNLNTLRCSSNLFSTIDLSKNTALQTLYCNYGNLSYLDLSKNLSIKLVFCQDNKLTNINVRLKSDSV